MTTRSKDSVDIKESPRFRLIAIARLLGLLDAETARNLVKHLAEYPGLEDETQHDVLRDLHEENLLDLQQLETLQKFSLELADHIEHLLPQHTPAQAEINADEAEEDTVVEEQNQTEPTHVAASQVGATDAEAACSEPEPIDVRVDLPEEAESPQFAGSDSAADREESQTHELDSPDSSSSSVNSSGPDAYTEKREKFLGIAKRKRKPEYFEDFYETWDTMAIRLLRDYPEQILKSLPLLCGQAWAWSRTHVVATASIAVGCLMLVASPFVWMATQGISASTSAESSDAGMVYRATSGEPSQHNEAASYSSEELGLGEFGMGEFGLGREPEGSGEALPSPGVGRTNADARWMDSPLSQLHTHIQKREYGEALARLNELQQDGSLGESKSRDISALSTALLLAQRNDDALAQAESQLLEQETFQSRSWRQVYATWLIVSTPESREVIEEALAKETVDSAWRHRLKAWMKSREQNSRFALHYLTQLELDECEIGDLFYRAAAFIAADDNASAAGDIEQLQLMLHTDRIVMNDAEALVHALCSRWMAPSVDTWFKRVGEAHPVE